jgi:hypothetical protein
VSQVPEEIHWSREAIPTRTFLAQNLGLGICAVNRSAPETAPYPEESLSQLFQPLVSVLASFGQYTLHYGTEPRLPPVVAGCRLCTRRVTEVRTLKQGARGRGIEARIIAVRERKSRRRVSSPGVLIYKSSRHS